MNSPDLIPVCSDVYIFNGSFLCEDCAAKIMKALDRKRVVDDGDSGTYPQGPHGDGGGEADSVRFCDSGRTCVNAVNLGGHKIGCPLGNPLTSDGVHELFSFVKDDLLSPKKFSRLVGRLMRKVWSEYTEPDVENLGYPRPSTTLPPSLVKLVRDYARKLPRGATHPKLAAMDTDSAYLVARLPDRVDLIRATADGDGEFKTLEISSTHNQAAEDVDDFTMIRDAVPEMAWD